MLIRVDNVRKVIMEGREASIALLIVVVEVFEGRFLWLCLRFERKGAFYGGLILFTCMCSPASLHKRSINERFFVLLNFLGTLVYLGLAIR